MDIDKLAYCGLTCDVCPIFLATRETDKEKQEKMRVQIADFVSKHYGTITKPEDITDCDGCKANTGRLYSGCIGCKISKCAQDKGCLTCAHCTEYPCDKLEKFFVNDPTAKNNLDNVRSSM